MHDTRRRKTNFLYELAVPSEKVIHNKTSIKLLREGWRGNSLRFMPLKHYNVAEH